MRCRALLALLLCALPASGATRLYFGSSSAKETLGGSTAFTDNTDYFITPTPDSGWEQTGEMRRSALHVGTPLRARGFGATYIVTLTEDSADQELSMQWQTLMPAGVEFVSGATTVSMQGEVKEVSSADNVNQCIIGIRIIDADGSTVNATLLAVANYGATTEFISGGGTNRNHTCANGDTVTATYTTEAGDWLVLETGFQSTGATDADPQATSMYSDGSGYVEQGEQPSIATTGDCPVDNTTVRCTGWIEFSVTWSTPTDAGPATRFYFPASTAADVSPAVTGEWDNSGDAQYREMVTTKGASAIADGQTLGLTANDFASSVDRVYVSDPMAAGIVFTKGQTTASSQLMSRDVVDNDLVRSSVLLLKIVSQDGATTRETLLDDRAIGHLDFTTTATNRSLVRGTPIARSYTTVSGDRVVAIIGYMGDLDQSAAVSPQVISRWGEDATDCAATSFTGTTDCAPWLELSNAITFSLGTPVLRPAWWGRFLMANPIGLVRSLLGRWMEM